MTESIKNRTNAISDKNDGFNLRRLITSSLTDLTSLVTSITAGIVDYTAGRAEIVKDIADYAAGRAEIVKDIADYAAGRAEIVKLVTDLGINTTFLDNLKTFDNNLRTFLTSDGIINPTVVSIGTTPENVATTACQYLIDGDSMSIAAVAAGTAFTDADTINTAAGAGLLWGAWLVQVNLAGTITTHSAGADQVHANEGDAIAAVPVAEAGHVALGYVTVQALSATAWTAATDDLTAASDCTGAFFYSNATSLPVAITDTSSSTASAPAAVTAVDPAAVTASNPAAVTQTAPTLTLTS